MKLILYLTLIACICVWSAAIAEVQNTPHDLTYSGNTSYFTGTGQRCTFCHAVHHADSDIAPLWNKDYEGTYQMYTSDTIDMSIDPAPSGGSLACLSCHDGVLAMNTVINPEEFEVGTTGHGTDIDPDNSLKEGIRQNIGQDLRNDHPVSVIYNALQDTKFKSTPDSPVSLDEGRVQCTSCHDPHNNAFNNFLVMSNSGSNLCRACHQF